MSVRQTVPPLPAPVHSFDFEPLHELVDAYAPGSEFSVEPMPGGASTRQYFRVELRSGSAAGKTAVAMFVPEGAKPEEVQKEAAHPRWPFLEVRDLLAERGVDVPAVYGEATSRGWVLLEDLGEDTLANYLLRAQAEKPALYKRAVHDLARAQRKLGTLPEHSIVATRAFDADLLLWELHHFREWALEARGTTLSGADRSLFDTIAERLARRVASWERCFVHRDYQSRNLMVRKAPEGTGATGLVWIDFQDALLGPRVYDLVALLNDSYQEFDRDFVEARLADYATTAELDAEERTRLVREFDLVTVQRKLKDAGRFVFIERVKNNPSFLPFVVPTIRKAAASLARLASEESDMATLWGLLRRILPHELGA